MVMKADMLKVQCNEPKKHPGTFVRTMPHKVETCKFAQTQKRGNSHTIIAHQIIVIQYLDKMLTKQY